MNDKDFLEEYLPVPSLAPGYCVRLLCLVTIAPPPVIVTIVTQITTIIMTIIQMMPEKGMRLRG